LVACVALIGGTVYFRGLYFTGEQLLFGSVLAAGFLVFLATCWRDPALRPHSLADWAAIGLVIAYVLSCMVAVNRRAALQEMLKYSWYVMAYWMISRLAQQSQIRRRLAAVVALAALGVALLGLGAALGIVSYRGAYQGGRISSTIQYPNSLAAYLTAGGLLMLGLGADGGRAGAAGWGAAASLVLLTIVFSYSRGAWLLLPGVLLLALVAAGSGRRLRMGVQLVAAAAPAVVGIPLFARFIGRGWSGVAVLVAVGGAAAGLALLGRAFLALTGRQKALVGLVAALVVAGSGVLMAYHQLGRPLALEHSPSEPSSMKQYEEWIPVNPDASYCLELEVRAGGNEGAPWHWRVEVWSYNALNQAARLGLQQGKGNDDWQSVRLEFTTRADTQRIHLLLRNQHAGTWAVYRNIVLTGPGGSQELGFHLSKLLPARLLSRLRELDPGTFSAWSRLVWTRDALVLGAQRPFLGAGGGGWKALYLGHQSWGYWTKEVHNHFAQVWVETGVVGLTAWLAFWAGVAQLAFRAVRERAPLWLVAGLVPGGVGLLLHSVLDFNLSLAGISLYLFCLAALVRADAVSGSQKRTRRPRSWWRAVVACFTAGVLVLSLVLYAGFAHGQAGVRLMKEGRISEAREAFRRAARYDPWQASFWMDLAHCNEHLARAEGSPVGLKVADEYFRRALDLEPYNPSYRALYGAFCLRVGNPFAGLSQLERALKLHPHHPQRYEDLARAHRLVGEMLLTAGREDLARAHLRRAVSVGEEMRQVRDGEPERAGHRRLPERTPALALETGICHFWLGELSEAQQDLEYASRTRDRRVKGEALLYLGLVAGRQQGEEAAEKLLREALRLAPDLQEQLQRLHEVLKKHPAT